MKVVKCPGQELAITNKAFCSPEDAQQFPPQSASGCAMVLVNNQIVLTVEGHPAIEKDALGLNAVHRRVIKVSAGDSVQVDRFVPEKGSEAVIITVELELIKYRGKQETLEADVLLKRLVKQFGGQVMTVEQKVLFEYLGTNYTFRVKEISLEENKSATSALLTKDTIFLFDTVPTSGTKVLVGQSFEY